MFFIWKNVSTQKCTVPTKQKEVKPHKAHSAKQKVKNLVACAIFEDIGQVYMQYFYFEKYMLENDPVVAVNMAFMFITLALAWVYLFF